MTTESAATAGASELLRSLGLLVDGPVRWGNPVSSRRPGIFVVELPGGADRAPVDIVSVRRWVERVPGMLVDSQPATPHDVARRLESFWLPSEPILYVGRSARAVGPRVAAMYETPLGDSKPYSGGHWLKSLSVLRDLRVWWADTAAHEEYEDGLLTTIAERNGGLLPFANLMSTAREFKRHGIEGSLLSEEAAAAGPSSKPATKVRRAASGPRKPGVKRLATRVRPASDPNYISQEGMDRLASELESLRTTVRPEVIARVKAARELGDLKENADYEYARKEQSFVEGRIQTIEALLRTGVVMDESPVSEGARLGSTVVVESDGEEQTYLLVGSAESDIAAGRISNVSPVGRALLGARAGDEVTVQLPNGSMRYQVREVR